MKKVAAPDLQYKDMQYLYSNGETYTFMDMETYDQVELSEKEIADTKNYIIENAIVRITIFEGRAVAVEVDNFVELKVAETQPNIKGDTSGSGGKPAIMETGLKVNVPFHINEAKLLR